MAKRISRRELKEKINTLKRRNTVLEYEVEEANEEKEKYKKRFEYLANEEWDQLDISRVEIKPEPWGDYVINNYPYSSTETIKQELTRLLVKGLIENDYVQIIMKEDIFTESVIIGAKLFVVPWERTVIGKANYKRISISKEDVK